MWRMIYEQLQHQYPTVTVDEWWGIDEPFERMVGSVLVQNTTWTNAAKALQRLRAENILSPQKIAEQSVERLLPAIHSAGFQQRKGETLITLSTWLLEKGGIAAIQSSAASTDELRQQLLSLKGIGEETADTILAYVFGRPSISGDAYARRLHERITGEKGKYGQIRTAMMAELQELHELAMLHALVVEHGKSTCRKRNPDCDPCRLHAACHHRKILTIEAADKSV